MIKKKNIIISLLLLAVFLVVLYKLDEITDYVSSLIDPTPKVYIGPVNEYTTNSDYIYVKKTKDFVPYSKQDILDIFYSFLDNGYETFTFYCPSEYTLCINDITNLINNQTQITDIGNFVHPYNNFIDIYLTTVSSGEVNLKITKTYSDEQIEEINHEIDRIFKEILTDEMDIKDKILKIHDYLIDNTYYDVDGDDKENAYNVFLEGKSKCFGYADAMSIMLHKLGVKNFKVGSNEHVWNAVYLDNEWTQIDVTWDDPIVQNGAYITNTIRHKFYMIDTDTLLSYDTKEHSFNRNIYRELK